MSDTCDSMDYRPPGSSVHGILQARLLEWVAFSPPGDLPDPGSNTRLLHLRWQVDSLRLAPPRKPFRALERKKVKLLSRVTLCDPVDCSLPGSSVHGILQARILEWVTISFSRGSSRLRDRTRVSHIGGRCFNVWATREAQRSK